MSNARKSQEFLPVTERVSIYLRGRTWYVNYQHDGQQIRRSLGTANKKEAILRAHRIEADLDRGSVPDQVRVATIGDVCAANLQSAEVEGRASKTLSKYRYVTKFIQQHAERNRRSHVAQLNLDFADSWRAELKRKSLSPKTIYNLLVILRSVTLFALKRRMSDVDPLVGYKLKKPKPTPQPCWSPEQAELILHSAPEAYRPYFTFLRETGCRAGEGKHLTWDDVDFRRRVIHIRPKDSWKPKSGDQRKVPMTERLAVVLEKLARRGRWVFTAPATVRYSQPDRKISERRALQALKRVLKRLKLPGHQHTFRHTFVSQALAAGVPEAVVQSWVGHVDRDVIRLYTHISDEVSQGYVSRFSAASRTAESQPNESMDGDGNV